MKLARYSILLFALILLAFAFFSTKVNFHDSPQYIAMSKEIAGISNSKVFAGHSIVYPVFISLFLKILPSLLTIKILNVAWLIAITLLLNKLTRNKKVLLLWCFSPIVWMMSIWISPLLPASFFFLLTYYFYKKWELENKKHYFALSALSFGICLSLWTAMIIFGALFLIVFFYDKKFKDFFYYLLLIVPTLLIRFILEYIYLGLPFYSFIRVIGSVLARQLGLASFMATELRSPPLELLYLIIFGLIIITPFLFKIYKSYPRYKQETIFVILAGVFSVIYTVQSYYLLIAPLAFVILNLKRKEIIVHSVLSVVIILTIITGHAEVETESYFGNTKDIIMQQDLKQINQDFLYTEYLAGDVSKDFSVAELNINYWDNNLYFVSVEDYKLYLENETNKVDYKLEVEPKINTMRDKLILNAQLTIDTEQDFDLPLITRRDIEVGFEEYSLTKCYQLLCVYEKTTS